MNELPGKSQFLIYQAENGAIKIDVRFEDETVWLTQQLMAELFQTTQQNISLHLQNIYEEGELNPEATHKEFLSVRQEGVRQISRSRADSARSNMDLTNWRGAKVRKEDVSIAKNYWLLAVSCGYPLCPSEVEFAGNEVDHGDQVPDAAIPSSFGFGCLDQAVDSFQ